MATEDLRSADLAGMQQTNKPRPTWFIERGDGKIFAVEEAEAWDLMKNRSNWMRRDFKFLGMSDGSVYFEHIKGVTQRTAEIDAKLPALYESVGSYNRGIDRLIVEEATDEEDVDVDEENAKNVAKLNRLRKMRDRVMDEITALEKERATITKVVYEDAFNKELERARGNMVAPSNTDIMTPHAQSDQERNKIINQIYGA